MTFEEQLRNIDDTVKKLQNGDVELEEAVRLYKEGTQQVGECLEMLRTAREQTLHIEVEEGSDK